MAAPAIKAAGCASRPAPRAHLVGRCQAHHILMRRQVAQQAVVLGGVHLAGHCRGRGNSGDEWHSEEPLPGQGTLAGKVAQNAASSSANPALSLLARYHSPTPPMGKVAAQSTSAASELSRDASSRSLHRR